MRVGVVMNDHVTTRPSDTDLNAELIPTATSDLPNNRDTSANAIDGPEEDRRGNPEIHRDRSLPQSAGAVPGAAVGGSAGAIIGAALGGPAGAVIGAVAGGLAAGAAGKAVENATDVTKPPRQPSQVEGSE